MSTNRGRSLIMVLAVLFLFPLGLASAQGPVGLDFTYQGYLTGDDVPIDGTCDFQFTLWDDPGAGSQVGPLVEQLAVPVGRGRFTTRLDFGSVYDGTALWLQVAVRCGDPGYTTLASRQAVTAAPYAAATLSLRGQPLSGAAPSAGQVLEWDGAHWTAAADDDTAYSAGAGLVLSGTVFSADETYLQRRVASCGDGSAIQQVNQDGSVVCQAVDNTRYDAGIGLFLAGTTLGITTTYRLPQGCTDGYIPEWNNALALWACGPDDDTTYTNGTGLDLAGTVFSVALAYRLPQGCANGYIARWDGAAWQCAVDGDTTYTAGNQLTLTGNTFDVVEGAGSDLDADLLDGLQGSAYQLRVNGTCPAGSSIRVVNPDGTVACEPDDDTNYTAGTGLDLVGTAFSIEVSYRLPQACAGGQGVVWNGASWVCTTYSAPGHNHWGETWGGLGIGLTLSSSDGTGLWGGGPVYGVWGTSTNAGVYGEGGTFGVYATGAGTAVYAGGGTYGLYATSPFTDGYGVYARNGTTTGTALRAQGGGSGVYASGNEYGVYGTAYYAGVHGNGSNVGVLGEATADAGAGVAGLGIRYGVYGATTVTTGTTYGIYGQSASPTGRGVQGLAAATAGVNYGVYGRTNSPAGWAGYLITTVGNGVYVSAPSGNVGLQVASGTKNAVVRTADGARLLYTEESTEVWFTDYGTGHLRGGRAVVPIDPLFAETVNLAETYHVFLTSLGEQSVLLSVASKDIDSFTVVGRTLDGRPAAGAFDYRIVARRLGYEGTRLERAPWADSDPNLYPEKRGEWEAQNQPLGPVVPDAVPGEQP